jgi:hypothetical protein
MIQLRQRPAPAPVVTTTICLVGASTIYLRQHDVYSCVPQPAASAVDLVSVARSLAAPRRLPCRYFSSQDPLAVFVD